MGQTVDRALSVLPLLAEDTADLGQVADHLGVHKSTALRILRTLRAHGLVHRLPDRRYRLGTRLATLAQRAAERLDAPDGLDAPELGDHGAGPDRRDRPAHAHGRPEHRHDGPEHPHDQGASPMTEKTALTPPTHAAPPAAFSHGVRKGNILQVAGQVAFLPAEEGRLCAVAGPGLREQTLQTLANVKAVLTEGGASWDDVMMIRVYLTDTAHFAEMNEFYDAYFAEQALTRPPAARTTVYVGLPPGLLIEIDALAVLG